MMNEQTLSGAGAPAGVDSEGQRRTVRMSVQHPIGVQRATGWQPELRDGCLFDSLVPCI